MSAHIVDLFRWVLEASWQGSLIIFLILCLRPILGAWIPARYRSFLWALVMVRLLIPVSFFPQNPACIQNIPAINSPIETVAFALPSAPVVNSTVNQPQGPAQASTPPVDNYSPSPVAIQPAISWWSIVSLIWFTGVVVGLIFMTIAHIRIWRRLQQGSAPPDRATQAIWDRCRTQLHVRRPVLRLSPAVTSPALVGLFRPVLFLPKATLSTFSKEDLEHIFTHELAHYRRDDHWANAFYIAALVVHWFNPLVWVGYRQLRADRELAADEWALRNLKQERSVAYGDTLLKVLAQSSSPQLSMVSVGILEDKTQLRQRLQRIGSFTPRTLLASALGAAVVVLVSILVIGQRTAEKVDFENYPDMSPEQMLLAAASDGDLPVVRKLINDGMSPNAQPQGSKGFALNNAAGHGNLDVLHFLVSKDANVNPNPTSQWTATPSAWDNGYGECAEFLIAHGAICDPSFTAAGRGDMAAIQKIIAESPNDFKKLERMCSIAAANGKPEAYSLLFSKIRQIPGQGYWSMLQDIPIQVVYLGHKEMAQLLIDRGERFNKNSVTRLSGAFAHSPEMRPWMEARGFTAPEYNNGEKLIDVSARGNIVEMTRLLKAGTDINYHGESSWTPLLYSAAWNNLNSVKYLLARGADPNAVHITGSNYTALNLSDNPQITSAILEAEGKGKSDAKGNAGTIDYCLGQGRTSMVEWFLSHGPMPSTWMNKAAPIFSRPAIRKSLNC